MWSAQEQDAAVGVGDTGTFWPGSGGVDNAHNFGCSR